MPGPSLKTADSTTRIRAVVRRILARTGPGRKKKFTDSNIFYIVAGIILALLVNQGLAFAFQTPTPIVAVESNSMVPVFRCGDILILTGARQDDLRIGDIIVFVAPGQTIPIVHRIITINDDRTFQTKGDAVAGQHSFELSIPYAAINGRVVTIVPYLGWVKLGATDLVTAIQRRLGFSVSETPRPPECYVVR